MSFIYKIVLLFVSFGFLSCSQNTSEISQPAPLREVPEGFGDYWFQGEGELTSYNLKQDRYGQIRNGTAVLIFVTEDFLPEVQVKANKQKPDNITVLKLNKIKNFNTGIYPYSIMNSTFSPVFQESHALKVSNSVQEWCGHVYAQINNREQFEIISHSYFENEADERFTLKKSWLEDELWTLLRIDPNLLPQGDIEMIPSLEYTRLHHKKIKNQTAKAILTQDDLLSNYVVHYPEDDRTLRIWFTTLPPFSIEKWEEQIGESVTKATKINNIKTAYWGKNKNEDEHLRDSLFIK